MRIIDTKVNKIVSLMGLPRSVLCVYSAYIGNYLENYKKLIGQKIRNRRKELGFTQDSLARLMDTDQSRIARWERGENLPDPKFRAVLLEKLQIDEQGLFSFEDAPGGPGSSSEVLPAILAGLATLNQAQLNTVLDLIKGFAASATDSSRAGSVD